LTLKRAACEGIEKDKSEKEKDEVEEEGGDQTFQDGKAFTL